MDDKEILIVTEHRRKRSVIFKVVIGAVIVAVVATGSILLLNRGGDGPEVPDGNEVLVVQTTPSPTIQTTVEPLVTPTVEPKEDGYIEIDIDAEVSIEPSTAPTEGTGVTEEEPIEDDPFAKIDVSDRQEQTPSVTPKPQTQTDNTPKNGDARVNPQTGKKEVYDIVFGWVEFEEGGGEIDNGYTNDPDGDGELSGNKVGNW